MQAQGLHHSVVRAYDIRGRVGETLFSKDAYHIGRAFGLWIRTQKKADDAPQVCVAYDGRLSSTHFSKSLIQGLCQSGCHVMNVGMGPTPLLYFSVQRLNAAGGIMVTASHNPAEDNGFKICLNQRPFFGEDLKNLDLLIRKHQHEWHEDDPVAAGSLEVVDMRSVYDAFLIQACRLKPLKVAWDPGHGAACDVVRTLIDTLPGEHRGLHMNIDGMFPAHPPDPTQPQNLEALRQAVLQHGCDIGIGFDGDADRVGIIDAEGHFVPADVLMQLYSQNVLKNHPGVSIIIDIKTSDGVVETIRRCGGKAITCRTGHSFIKQKMKETGALCAGELSGHFFFADRYDGFDDGVYASLRLLEILSEYGPAVLTEARQRQMQVYHTRELQLKVPEGMQFDRVDQIKQCLAHDQRIYEDTDGVKVRHTFGWWLLRASNTESKLIGRCEARSQKDLDTIEQEMQAYLTRA